MQRVVVLSESAARFFWPDEDPVGKLLPLSEDRAPEASMRVVGVVADAVGPDVAGHAAVGHRVAVEVLVRNAAAADSRVGLVGVVVAQFQAVDGAVAIG